jgi:hypothetical protein
VDLPRRLMKLMSSVCVNRTPESRSAAAGGRSSSACGFDVMAQAAIGVEAASASKYTSSGLRYSMAW